MATEQLKGPVFAAAGMSGLRMFSRDGRNWVNDIILDDKRSGRAIFETLCFNQGRLLTVYTNYKGAFFYSTSNGVDWEDTMVEDSGKNTFKFPFTFQDKFYASGAGWINSKHNPELINSDDGLKWSKPKKIGGNRGLIVAVEGKDRVVAGGTFGRKAMSKDGKNWEDAPDPDVRDTFLSLAYGNGVFVGGGLHGMTMRSEDGVNWTDRREGEEGEHINSLFFDGKKFVGISQLATFMSLDGREWKRFPIAGGKGPITAAYGNGTYVGVRWKGQMMISPNGVEWEDTADFDLHLECLGYGELAG
jgi:hypothetical protein